MPTVFDTFNRKIFDFINEPENRRLRPGTGSYSTPFRGTVSGESDSAAADASLARGGVGVLWLGANPNVPGSVKKILALDAAGDGDFASFERQMRSGRVGEQRWDERGTPQMGWDPINAPVRGWTVYADVLTAIGGTGGVAMANFLPWGSSLASEFWTPMKARHPELLERVLRFADELNVKITRALRPRLIVVPKSLGGSPELSGTGIARSRATDVQHREIELSRRRFRFTTARIERDGDTWPVAYLPHPSALHYSQDDRRTIRQGLGAALTPLLGAE